MSFKRYQDDIQRLVADGRQLLLAMVIRLDPKRVKGLNIDKEKLGKLPDFTDSYQSWYSEAVVCISQLLPDRLEDFTSYYKPLRQRKNLTNENYTISDYLQGLQVTRFDGEVIVGLDAAFSKFRQQLNIVEALERRFESSLFDIRGLVQADLFDNELDIADELNKKGFHRGGGAIAGVVLEGHLRTVCTHHSVSSSKTAMLGKLNDNLKASDVLDVPTWRFIQHLIDLRNLCDHKLPKDPTKENIEELVAGVRKVTKTVF
ncbi:MAG: hypothetical protein MN733_39555 [Nitrososphaera sp.]|nr:hypothetical protein [Nitrososphaera sp.]